MKFSWNDCQAAHGRNVWKACRNYWRICTSCWGKFLEHAPSGRSQVSVATHRQHAMLKRSGRWVPTRTNKKFGFLEANSQWQFDRMYSGWICIQKVNNTMLTASCKFAILANRSICSLLDPHYGIFFFFNSPWSIVTLRKWRTAISPQA